ncbi:Vgb family protein [Nocardioides flavescens]|uniref:Uncharacterized protein n=1 Tax=Nocardioides flavescens TaxID=2691959 RepID=A0A6L7F2A2_9ACTN|nr:hypothetical protein [Nocardioides flavescens]MXG91321.1 hypothetical protein [Nocardioides flavescens]
MHRFAVAATTAVLTLTASAMAAGALPLPAAADAPSTGVPTYYSAPSGYAVVNYGVTVDGSGDVWFSASGPARGSQPTPSLIRLHPASAVAGTAAGTTTVATPDPSPVGCCANQMRSVAFSAHDGRLYYVRSDGAYGSLVPSAPAPATTISTGTAAGGVDLWDVATAPGGGAWITEKTTSNVAPYPGARIAQITDGGLTEGPNVAVQGGATTLTSSRYDAKPSGITVAADGTPWFVEEDPGTPGYRIASYTGGATYNEYAVTPCEAQNPCSGSYSGRGLTDVAAGGDGGLWFTNRLNKKIGRLDPGSGTMTQYTLASISPSLVGGSPSQIAAAPDGSLWVSVSGPPNALVHVVPGSGSASATATVTSLGSVQPLGLTVTATDVWFGTVGSDLGRLPLAPSQTTPTTPTAPTQSTGTTTGTTTPTTPAPVALTPVSVGQAQLSKPRADDGEVTANQICLGPPTARCTVIYRVSEHEYVPGFRSGVAKPRPRTLAKKSVVLTGGQSAKVKIRLNGLGRRILAARGRLKVDVLVSERQPDGSLRKLSTSTLTVRAPERS